MDSFFSGGGSSRNTTTSTSTPNANTLDPTLQALNALRLALATRVIAGGLPAAMGGYLSRMVVPNTINTLTASGFGRSGAMGEAVANASMQYGTNFLTSLMTGIPSQANAGSTTTKTEQSSPGLLDWLGPAATIAGLWGKNGPFGTP